MINRDTDVLLGGHPAGELRIQKCNACGELRHPPGPVCPTCHAMDRGYVVASGRGTVFVPGAPRAGSAGQGAAADDRAGRARGRRADGRRGQQEEVAIGDAGRGLVGPGRRRADAGEVAAGRHRRSPSPSPRAVGPTAWELPITPTLVVSTALATRDFQDVHHDRDLDRARLQGHLHQHPEHDRAGAEVRQRLGRTARPGSCRARCGSARRPTPTTRCASPATSCPSSDGVTTIDVVGRVSLGDHVERATGGDPADERRSAAAAAIAGIGATEFSKESGRSELQLSAEATLAALADAGLDGRRRRRPGHVHDGHHLRDRAGARARHGRPAVLQPDQLRRRGGVRDRAAGGDGGRDRRGRRRRGYRGFNERSGQRFGQVQKWAAEQVNTNGLDNAWTYPHGLSTPAATVAMQARRYMHEYGATSADFGARRGGGPAARGHQPRTRSSTRSRSRSRTTRARG